jgi:hypothetical protein
MKKVITLSVVAVILMLTAASCNKMCVCTETHEDPNIPTEIYERDLESAGLKKCSDLDIIIEDAYGRTIIECVNQTK